MSKRLRNANLNLMSESSIAGPAEFDDEMGDLSETEEDLIGLSPEDAYGATVSASDWTAETLLRQIQRGNVDLDPQFQRREAWTATKQSRYIESLIVGLPVPQIVLAERQGTKGKFLVLDGKQRLLSMKKFMTDGLKLTGLDLRRELNNKRFDDLNEDDRNALENQTLRTVTVRNWKSEDFLYLVFLRLNTASVPLSPQELRTALHPGPFIKYTNEFTSSNSDFARLFRRDATVDFRMRDIELLIRFFSFALYLPEYDGSLKNLLDLTCAKLNSEMEVDADRVNVLAETCLDGVRAVNQVFGRDAFRLWNPKEVAYESRFNRAVFDVLVFSLRDEKVRTAFLSNGPAVQAAFQHCCEDEKFRNAVTSTTKSKESVNARLSIWAQYLSKALQMSVISTELRAGDIAYSSTF